MNQILSWPTICIIGFLAIVGAGYLGPIVLAYFLRWRDARSAQRSEGTGRR
jgi:hypothetical protein